MKSKDSASSIPIALLPRRRNQSLWPRSFGLTLQHIMIVLEQFKRLKIATWPIGVQLKRSAQELRQDSLTQMQGKALYL